MRLPRALCAFSIGMASTHSVLAQHIGTGLYAFGSFENKGFDTVNLGNLNIHFQIPIVNKPGRCQGFNYSLAYDELLWSAVTIDVDVASAALSAGTDRYNRQIRIFLKRRFALFHLLCHSSSRSCSLAGC